MSRVENVWDFMRRKGTFNEISRIHSCFKDSFEKYDIKQGSEIIVWLKDSPGDTCRCKEVDLHSLPSPYYYSEGAELGMLIKDRITVSEEFERWRRTLMCGKLDLGKISVNSNFKFQSPIHRRQILEKMFNEFDSQFPDSNRDMRIDDEPRQDGTYHAYYSLLSAVVLIKKLPDHLKAQRRELILRNLQVKRAGKLVSYVCDGILGYTECGSKEKKMEIDEILNRFEESKELLAGSHPSRLEDDAKRYTENLYDFFGVPVDARRSDPIHLPIYGYER
ncbi:hypothetical protein FJZ19_03940 [Candidatus Pacearchaeota archaeon]|nr:hypothetical protein [Candidatus Pacearchaeota archaeon]